MIKGKNIDLNNLYKIFIIGIFILCGLYIYKYLSPEKLFYSETKKVYGRIIDKEMTHGAFGKTNEYLISYYFITTENDTVFSKKRNRNLNIDCSPGCEIGVEYQINKPEKNNYYFLKNPENIEYKVIENLNYKLTYTNETFVYAKKYGKYMLKDKKFGIVLNIKESVATLKNLKTKEIEKINLNDNNQLNILFHK